MKRQKIVFSYLTASILIFAIITVFAGLIFGSKIHFVLLFFVLFIMIFTVDFTLALAENKLSKIIRKVMPMLSTILGFIFLI